MFQNSKILFKIVQTFISLNKIFILIPNFLKVVCESMQYNTTI